MTGILVPAKRVWRIKRSRGNEACNTSMIDDGADKLSEDQSEVAFNDLADQLKLPSIVGCTLDDCFTSRSSASQASTACTLNDVPPSSSKVSAQQSTPTKGTNPFGSTFSLSPFVESSSAKRGGGNADTQPAGTRSEVKGQGRGRGATSRSAKTGHSGAASARVPRPVGSPSAGTVGGAAGRGRPAHDTMIVSDAQIKMFSECSDTDAVFFGKGFKNHKAFLVKTRGTIEVRMQAAEESHLCACQRGRSKTTYFQLRLALECVAHNMCRLDLGLSCLCVCFHV